jgi:hypothetical protein
MQMQDASAQLDLAAGLAEQIGDIHIVVNSQDVDPHPVHPATACRRRGSRAVNSVNSPTSLSTVIVPLCCWHTIDTQDAVSSRTCSASQRNETVKQARGTWLGKSWQVAFSSSTIF